MIETTLKAIRSYDPRKDCWGKLLAGLGKTKADDTVVTLPQIIDICGLDDALWCLRCWPEHDKAWRKLAVSYARQVQCLMTDQRSVDALHVADRHADGEADDAELSAAGAAAWEAARAAAWAAVERGAAGAAAEAAAGAAAWEAVREAAGTAAGTAARAAARKMQADMLLACIKSL